MIDTFEVDHYNHFHQKQILDTIISNILQLYIHNLSIDDITNTNKLFFQLQYSYWSYLDNYLPNYSFLPKMKEKEFIYMLYHKSYLLQQYINNIYNSYIDWTKYIQTIPVYGSIIIDTSKKYILLLEIHKDGKIYFDFPKGKVYKNEDPKLCAIRETLEETGIDISKSINEHLYIETYIGLKYVRLYLIFNVDLTIKFNPQVIGESDGYIWANIKKLPLSNKWSYVIKKLKHYVRESKKSSLNLFY
jgi:mRNA-decapping enzyme subunit 2